MQSFENRLKTLKIHKQNGEQLKFTQLTPEQQLTTLEIICHIYSHNTFLGKYDQLPSQINTYIVQPNEANGIEELLRIARSAIPQESWQNFSERMRLRGLVRHVSQMTNIKLMQIYSLQNSTLKTIITAYKQILQEYTHHPHTKMAVGKQKTIASGHTRKIELPISETDLLNEIGPIYETVDLSAADIFMEETLKGADVLISRLIQIIAEFDKFSEAAILIGNGYYQFNSNRLRELTKTIDSKFVPYYLFHYQSELFLKYGLVIEKPDLEIANEGLACPAYHQVVDLLEWLAENFLFKPTTGGNGRIVDVELQPWKEG